MKSKPKSIVLLIIFSVILGMLQSCFLFSGKKNKLSQTAIDTHEQNGFAKAAIINYAIDGCTFMIQLEDGKKLEPVNLQDEFKKDNLKVWIKYKHFKGNSICMAGEMVTITAIETR